MKHPKPVDAERSFEAQELFFSRTDARGLILSGNDVFTRISGYAKEELQGAPHNIIRHPDMPKAVFRLLWDTLKAGNPIGAYVKNLAADGKYYWVFALARPVKGGFLSIRLKPTSPIVKAVSEVYKKALAAEQVHGMDGGLNMIIKELAGLGFPDYTSFMIHSLVEEYLAREKATVRHEGSLHAGHSDPGWHLMLRTSNDSTDHFKVIFDSLGKSVTRTDSILQGTDKILRMFKDLQFLTINMTIISRSCGTQARSLVTISEGFQRMADEIRDSLLAFKESTASLSKRIASARFEIAAAALQTEMVNHFFNEKASSNSNSFDAEFIENCHQLVQTSSQQSALVGKTLSELRLILSSFIKEVERLTASVHALSFIQVAGRTEAARIDSPEAGSLHTYIDEMQNFVSSIQPLLGALSETTQSYAQDARDSGALLTSILFQFNEIEQNMSRKFESTTQAWCEIAENSPGR